MRKIKPVVFAYDITNNKTRSKVLGILKEWRMDGQKSVHECCLSKQNAEELFIQISSAINTKTDNLILAWIDQNRKILARGRGKTDSIITNAWLFT